MVEHARVLLLEDDELAREGIEIFITRAGHSVVRTASTFEDSKEAIKHIKRDGIQIVVVDGNLTPGDSGNEDGEDIVRDIRSDHPEVGIIGNASVGKIRGADVQVPKSKGGLAVAEAVTRLPYPMRRIP